MKDRLTLLFCANASGDLKIKPLLVYHSENPRAFKKHKVDKEQLSVMWRSNSKAWVTRVLFVDWVNLAFGPAVKQYLLDNNLPLKALLLMDNAPAHPKGLEVDLLEEISQRNLNCAWRSLWPDCVAPSDSDAPESTVVQDIVALGRTMGLEVTEEDISELVEEHDHELTTQELVKLQDHKAAYLALDTAHPRWISEGVKDE
ncbi:tigger transposable element-derived protein 1-like [Podarcis raffonei]|uniref:tigger transposable element-derived protein 1-like n=1 Tax=Podarcis raffonei TaxID=65483 RepID=UPI0023291550|nr:tigger transposable element-derived protein 1-like [Podarcis raffonei]